MTRAGVTWTRRGDLLVDVAGGLVGFLVLAVVVYGVIAGLAAVAS